MSSSVLQPALQDVLAASLADGGFADTKFYLYSKRVKGKPNAVHTLRTVYANSTILKAASPYFNGLLCGARSDSAIPRSDSYDDSEDSDLEDDDEDEPRRGVKTEYNSTASPVSETTQVSSSRAMRTVVINDAAATTWQSLVFYIYTGLISFAPLKSQGVQYREAEKVQHHSEFPHRPPMCSPKSMYNLADKLGLKELKERAASFIRLQLKPQNILDELFSSFTSKHPDILRTQVDFFRDNCRNMSFAAAMRRQLGRVASGELPHAVPAMVALYEEWVYGRPVSQPQWTRSVPPPQPMPISTSYSRTSSPSPIIIKCSPSRSPSPLYDLSRPIYSPMPSSKPGSTSQLSPSPQAITPQTPSHLSSALSSVTRTERPGIGSEPAFASGRASRNASRGSSIPGLRTVSPSSEMSFPGGQEVPRPKTTSASFCPVNPSFASAPPAPAPPPLVQLANAAKETAAKAATLTFLETVRKRDTEPPVVPAIGNQSAPVPPEESSRGTLTVECQPTPGLYSPLPPPLNPGVLSTHTSPYGAFPNLEGVCPRYHEPYLPTASPGSPEQPPQDIPLSSLSSTPSACSATSWDGCSSNSLPSETSRPDEDCRATVQPVCTVGPVVPLSRMQLKRAAKQAIRNRVATVSQGGSS